MRAVRALAAVLAVGVFGVAYAQNADLFISPMGEPFRREGEAPAPIQQWFAQADTDADGRLTRDEFTAQAATFFRSTLDANGDGRLTSVESTALWRARAPEMLSRNVAAPVNRPPRLPLNSDSRVTVRVVDGREAAEPGPSRSGAALYGIMDDAEPVLSCDADRSRWVTAEEFEACAARRFGILDADGDGFFSLAESPRAAAFIDP